jgi:hypothetical protein
MEMKPANSMQGFMSVSLRVPSSDPLPSCDASAVHLQVPAFIERPPGVHHSYHTLELPNRAPDGTGEQRGKEERRDDYVAALNPDNRTNLRDVTQPCSGVSRDGLTKNGKTSVLSSLHQERQQGADSSFRLPLQHTKVRAVNTSLPPVPEPAKGKEKVNDSGYVNTDRGKNSPEDPYDDVDLNNKPAAKPNIKVDENGYVNTEREKNLEGSHKYDDVELKDAAAPKSKPAAKDDHDYDLLDGDSSDTRSPKLTKDRETVYTAHVLKSTASKDNNTVDSKTANSLQTPSAHATPPDVRTTKEWVSIPPGNLQSRRTTYSSTPTELMFDDPMYDASLNENSIPRKPTTTALGDPHPRTHSLMQSFKQGPTVRRDYELTENITIGDVSRPELSLSKPQGKCESMNLFDDPEYEEGLNFKR